MGNEIIDGTTVQSESIRQEALPQSGGILAMGILSIVFAGLVGLILGIIAISQSSTALELYNQNPDKYTEGSYKNVKAGRICAIVGISLLGFALLIVIMVVASM